MKSVFKSVYRAATSPVKGPLLTIAVFVLLPLLCAIAFSATLWMGSLWYFTVTMGLCLLAETVFRLGYRLVHGRAYAFIPRLPFDQLYIEPHPYLSYIYKRHAWSQRGGEAQYPLHIGKFQFGQYQSNNFRFINGPQGNRDILVPKPAKLRRIACIGASTTGNYIVENGTSCSYPMELERILVERLGENVEVNNCGVGGYNSADLLIRFALAVVDTAPDVVVIYHAYNDIRAYLTPGFDGDYSHCRRNLGESYWKYAISGRLPQTPLAFVNFLTNQWLPSNIRYSLLEEVSRGTIDYDADPSLGLETYRRNLQSIIALCHSRGIKVVLSTYCHFLYDAIRESSLNQLYDGIVAQENTIMRELAAANGVSLVDNAAQIPREERYFVDSVHFTPDGMRLLAENIAPAVIECLVVKSQEVARSV